MKVYIVEKTTEAEIRLKNRVLKLWVWGRIYGVKYSWNGHHFHLDLSLNRGGPWVTTDDFATSVLHFSVFSTPPRDLANSMPVHSLMSSHLFFCLPCLLSPFTLPCKMVLARSDEREICPHHFSFCLFTTIRTSPCGPITCWILAQTSSLLALVS